MVNCNNFGHNALFVSVLRCIRLPATVLGKRWRRGEAVSVRRRNTISTLTRGRGLELLLELYQRALKEEIKVTQT